MTGRQRTLAALEGAPADSPPVWLMRQAGRYLPEYRAVRAACSFMELVRDPARCTEVALQPLRRYDLDATIVFSDILVIPDALGAGLSFQTGDGPRFDRPCRDQAAADALADHAPGLTDRLSYVYAAVAALRAAAPDHALFGFAGSPWTLFCYLVEGGGNSDFWRPRALLWQQPDLAARLLDLLADAAADHLAAQAEAGADALQIFDTWGGLLPAPDYQRHVLPSLLRLHARLSARLSARPGANLSARAGRPPVLLFARNGGHLLPALARTPFDAFSLDATVDLVEARRILRRPTQGNLDNTRLLGAEAAITEGVQAIRAALKGAPDHVYNLGHGILPQTPPEAVTTFVRAVRAGGAP